MRWGCRGGRDALAAQIGKLLDSLVFAHPKLRGGELDRVGEKHLTLPTRRKVRDHRAGGQHVYEFPVDRRKQLDAVLEFRELRVETVLCPCPDVIGQPYLFVDRQGMKIA